jgi:Txe/YoeB family toxin of toxin-antitoxin system
MFKIKRSAQARRDAEACERAGYKAELDEILGTVERAPYEFSQGFERLTGNLKGYCSRKINHGNRFVYKVLPNTERLKDDEGNLYDGIVLVYEAWRHRYKKSKN